MLKLKLQYFGHLMWRADSLKKTLMPGKIEGSRRREYRGWDDWAASWLNGCEFEQTPGDSEGQGSLACCSPWGHRELDTTKWLNITVHVCATGQQGLYRKPLLLPCHFVVSLKLPFKKSSLKKIRLLQIMDNYNYNSVHPVLMQPLIQRDFLWLIKIQ